MNEREAIQTPAADLPISMARMAIDILRRSPGWFFVRRKSLEAAGFPKPIPVLKAYLPSGVRRAVEDLRLDVGPKPILNYEIDTYVPWAKHKKADLPFSSEAWDRVPGVYLISFATFLKIGVSNNIGARLRSIQSNLPDSIAFHGAIIGANETDERDLHRRFAAHRRNGEWFTLDPEIVAYIEGAKKGGHKQ